MTDHPLLPTRRLLVRRFTSADLSDFLAYQADPRVREYLPGEPMDAEKAARYLESQAVLDEAETGQWHAYAVQHVASGTVIGDVGVYLVSSVEGDIGFQFNPAFQGQGYAIEAMTALVELLFGSRGLERLTAGCDEGNRASRALLERLGLRLLADQPEAGVRRYARTREMTGA